MAEESSHERLAIEEKLNRLHGIVYKPIIDITQRRSIKKLNLESRMQIKGILSRFFKRQHGAAMTELLVSLQALLLMGLGGMQSALLFDAKTTVNYATFEAGFHTGCQCALQ